MGEMQGILLNGKVIKMKGGLPEGYEMQAEETETKPKIVRLSRLSDEELEQIAKLVYDRMGASVYGAVKEGNILSIGGILPVGTFTVRFELEDGSTAEFVDIETIKVEA